MQEDWFIYLNGIATNKGAGQCRLYDGDIVHMDFHNWTFRPYITALVGHVPEPFSHGFEGQTRPTIVTYDAEFEELAAGLRTKIEDEGLIGVSLRSMQELTNSERKTSNLIIIGGPDNDLVSEMNSVWNRLGFFIHFEEGQVVVYDENGDADSRYGAGTGVIQMSQSPWNPKGTGVCENVVLMVSGVDTAGVISAVESFIDGGDELRYAFAAAVVDGAIVRVPR